MACSKNMKQNRKLIEKNHTKHNMAKYLSDLRHRLGAEKNQWIERAKTVPMWFWWEKKVGGEKESAKMAKKKISWKLSREKCASVSSSFNYPRLFLIMCLWFQKDRNPFSTEEYLYAASFMHTLQKILSLAG